jgi:hypothetical protein
MSKLGRMHANGAFGKAPAPRPRVVYEADTLSGVAAQFPSEQWAEHTVIVVPRPGMAGDSNTGIVWKSPDSSLLGAVLKRPGSTGEVDCDVPTLNGLIGARPGDMPVAVDPDPAA